MVTKDEALKLALEALKQIDEAMPFPVAKLAQKVIREALAQPEQEPELIECGNCHEGLSDMDHVCPRCLGAGWINNPASKPEQEPVAWLHTKIEGVAVPHRPADLDKHPDRWEALYKTPPPCPTCEALARTVMLDQTYHDAQRKPLPKGEWPKHPSGYVGDVYKGYDKSDLDNYAMQVLAAHGIKEIA